MANFTDEYKNLIVGYLRDIEARRNYGHPAKQQRIDQMSDDDLLRRWCWIVAIVGGLVCFIALPIVLRFLTYFIPFIFLALLWTVLRLAMGVVAIIFCFAVYLTVRRPRS